MKNYTRIELEQGSPEWHEFRSNHIGASDAPVIMGVSPWKTPYQLWREKLGYGDSQKFSPAMQRGIFLEEKARLAYSAMKCVSVQPAVLKSNTIPYMAASLDGISACGCFVVEIKCPGEKDHALALQGKIPEKYMPQIQHQMFVANVQEMDYFSFDGESGVIVPIKYDAAYSTKMLKAEANFWHHVCDLTPPEGAPTPVYDPQFIQLGERWIELQGIIEKASEEQDEIRKKMIDMAGGYTNLQIGKIRMTRSARGGSINYKAIPQIQGVDLEAYRKPSIDLWRISIIKENDDEC